MNCILQTLICFAAVSFAYEASYDNYKVYRIIPETKAQLHNVRLFETSDSSFEFWSNPISVNVPVDIMVPPQKEVQFFEILLKFQLNAEIIIKNVQRLIEQTTAKSNHINAEFGWHQYYGLNEIYEWLDKIASSNYPHVELITAGYSYQNRPIKGVKVSFKKGNKAVFIEGGIHGREWIATATVTYVLNELLTSKHRAVREIAESYDWYILPTVNPDGYEHSFKVNRLWRKTLTPYGICKGADGNRNWNFHWNETGTTQKCSEFYPGSSPFSEPEMKSLSEYISSIAENLVVYLSIHSYFQLLLIPYGHGEYADNYSEHLEIGEKAASSLRDRHGTEFDVGNWAEEVYTTSGVSADWIKAVHKVPIVYTYELRDKNKYLFLLPPKYIIPSGEEFMDSLVTMIKEVKSRGY